MPYEISKKVCLWRIKVIDGRITVIKEVIVTITEIKTGVPGEFSGEPVSSQSLRGIGDDGKTYEKHWESSPESQIYDFIGQWSLRDDGEGGYRFWIPREAIHFYNEFSLRKNPTMFRIVDRSGAPVTPKNFGSYCEEHDQYSYSEKCLPCLIDKRVVELRPDRN